MLASGFYQNKRLYPAILYNEQDIDHGTDTITNRGTGGDLTMTNFARNNGTVSGGVTISDGAMVFNGSTGYVTVPNSTDWSGIDWSIFSRVYINDLPSASTGGVISSQANGTGTGRNLLYVYNAAGTYQWRTAIGGSGTVFSGLTEPSSGTLYNTCLVKQGTSLKLYVNTEDSSLTKTMESATGNFIIGSSKTAASLFFDGPIKCSRFYNKALSSGEVAQEQASGTYSTINDGSLVWQLTGSDYAGTEASPTTIYDTNMVVEGHEAGSYAIEFDGSNDYLVLANSTDYSGIDWSFFARFYFNGLPSGTGSHSIIGQLDGTGTGDALLYTWSASGTLSWRTLIGGVAQAFSITAPTTSTLYNVCLVKQGTAIKLYVNNESDTVTATMNSSNGDIRIGTNKGGATYTKGLIEDPRIFKKALTPTEIQRLFNS